MNKNLQRLHKLKVLVATCSDGMWHAEFGASLCNLLVAFHSHKVGNYRDQTLNTYMAKGSILPKLRYGALKQAKEMEADYLLFVDSDQTFPRSTLHRLIEHDVDVVGANVAVKMLPSQPTARRESREGEPPFGMPVFTDHNSTGLEKVWRIGTGLLLLSKKAYSCLPANCFEMLYKPDVDDYGGEDWRMMEFLAERFPIYIDHDLSKHVGHVGLFTFTHDWVGQSLPEIRDGEES